GIKNIEISLRRAELRKEIARLKKERRLALFKNDLISREEKEDLELNQSLLEADIESLNQSLEQMRSQLESSKIELSYTVINAPIDGVVLERKVNEGQTVVSGFQAPILFRVADLKNMQIECDIDEKYLNHIKEGREVEFDVAYTTHKFKGSIKQIRYSPKIVEGTARYPTIIEVNNSEMRLIPGVVRVRLEEKLN
ncbi:MAG: efflux RND transporter periplasmic adaptor subunit, partial [Patescibacteria group bacterium]